MELEFILALYEAHSVQKGQISGFNQRETISLLQKTKQTCSDVLAVRELSRTMRFTYLMNVVHIYIYFILPTKHKPSLGVS